MPLGASQQTPRLILLTGAPAARALTWTAHDLTAPLLPPFADVIPSENSLSGFDPVNNAGASSSQSLVAWRSLQLYPGHLHTGGTLPTPQLELVGEDLPALDEAASFLSAASFYADHEQNKQQSSPRHRFFEHSLVLHDEAPSSQIMFASLSQNAASGREESFRSDSRANDSCHSTQEDSFRSFTSAGSALLAAAETFEVYAPPPPLTSLSALPSAGTLESLHPQTLTITLLAGIVDVPSSPRQVVPRRWRQDGFNARSLDLLEIVLGDPTRSGFSASLWLGLTPVSDRPIGVSTGPRKPSALPSAAEQALRSTALALCKGDVVVIRNLALASWRGAVYGQSLRRGMTTIEMVRGGHCPAEAATATTSPVNRSNAMHAAMRHVHDWVSAYVPLDRADPAIAHPPNGADRTTMRNDTRSKRTLPLDTQEA